MRVLVVEDDQEKKKDIIKCILETAGAENASIEDVRDSNAAKALLKKNAYDLLVLDVAIPPRNDADVKHMEGVALLDEILSRSVYCRPKYILGVTAFVEVLEEATKRFREDFWDVVFYDDGSTEWSENIKKFVRHVVVSGAPTGGDEVAPVDLGVVTALYDPELVALLSLEYDWKVEEVLEDDTIYYRGKLQIDEGIVTIVAAASPRMGAEAATAVGLKLTHRFKPRYLAMVGVCAGMSDMVNIGDVVVAERTWSWDSGKWKVEDGEQLFVPEPHQLAIDRGLKTRLDLMARDNRVCAEIEERWPGKRPVQRLKMVVGPLVSGSSVLQDEGMLKWIDRQHRKVVGIDMETYGVFLAGEECAYPKPKTFAMKGVQDYANSDKNDEFREYSAFTSAVALDIFVRKYLFAACISGSLKR